MSNARALLGIAVLFSLLCVNAQAQRGPSTPAEREQIKNALKMLETKPLDGKTTKEREKAMMTVIMLPDVKVSMCGAALTAIMGQGKDPEGVLMATNLLGMAAHIIDNPSSNFEQQVLAATESMLRAYETMLRSNSKKYKNEDLDALIAKRADGSLAEWAKDVAGQCK